MRRSLFARITMSAYFSLAFASASTDSLSAQAPNDPFVREQVDSSPPHPEHYKTFQWHLGYSLYGPYNDIHAAGAWDYNLGHAYLGILDAGIAMYTSPGFLVHEDLAANFREHLSPSIGNDLFARAPAGGPYGHGMHVMGLAAGRSNNGKGISGVCRECSTLLGNKIFASEASLLESLSKAGAQVVNMSFGGTVNPSLQAAIEGIAAQRDVVLVAAAGNGNANSKPRLNAPEFPASHPAVIGVAGSAPSGRRWDESPTGCRQATECYSKYGGNVQLAAPALNVLSAWYPGNQFASPTPLCGDALHGPGTNAGSIHPVATAVDGYGLCTGTSMSAAIVTGVAGLIRSVNPLLSAQEVRTILNNTAQPTPDSELGRGIVQAQSAVIATLGKSNAMQVKNRLTPLFSLYSSGAEDYLYTTVPQMASAAINDTRHHKYSTPTSSGMTEVTPYASRTTDPAVGAAYGAFPGGAGQIPRAAVYIFTGDRNPISGAKDLVPLYRLSYIADSATNTNNRDHTYTTDAAGLAAYQSVGYKLDGIEGYIYSKTVLHSGTVKLLRRYNPKRDDHAIFPESQLAAMLAEGYTQLSGSDWLGYVYPNLDADGDSLINGLELILGTKPLGVDSDLDGRRDGVEYPLADLPVSDPLRF